MILSSIPLSVFIITKNEEDRLPKALETLPSWIEDRVVVDSGSSDDTTKIAEELGARVFFNEWKGYGPQKQFAEKQCLHPWILNIDADEYLSPELQDELYNLFQISCDDILLKKAYSVPIVMLPRFTTTSPKNLRFARIHAPIRLYHRDYAGFKDSIIHDSVELKVDIKTSRLCSFLLHRSCRSFSHAIDKINYYSSLQAEEALLRNKKSPSLARIMSEPFIAFFKAYVIRRYFLYGIEGLLESFLYSMARSVRLAKMWEKNQEMLAKKLKTNV